VFQDEVNPAIDASDCHGIEITGLHNHFFFDEPKVYFNAHRRRGLPGQIGQGVRAVLGRPSKSSLRKAEPALRFMTRTAAGVARCEKLASIIGSKGAMETAS